MFIKLKFLGTPDDPNFHEQEALVFQRRARLVDPINLPLFFTNSICDYGFPKYLQQFRDNVKLDRDFIDFCKRRVNWCLNNDSTLLKLPINREYPYLDQRPPRVYGTTSNRKELSLLRTLYDVSSLWTAKNFGFNPNVCLQRVSSPICLLNLKRDNMLTVLDLHCDFLTLLSPSNTQAHLKLVEFDDKFKNNTSNKQLNSISPLSWQLAFKPSNFYNTNHDFKIPANSSIQTLFLSSNSPSCSDEVDNFRGRAIMFCYGYAAQQAKLKHQIEDVLNINLEKPIQIQCFFTNPNNFTVGSVLFQLNTMNLSNEEVRNQVWFTEARSLVDDTEEAIVDLITIQSRGLFDNILKSD